MKSWFILCCIVLLISGCSGVNPQSRKEFVQMNVKGGAFSMVDSYVAHKPFDDVVRSLKERAAACLNTDVTTRRSENGMRTMNITDEFRTNVRVVNADRAELTTQFTSKGITYVQKVPAGGFYHRAVDIVRLSAGTTKLTYYGSSFDSSKKTWSTIKQWSDGQATPCP